MARAPKKLKHCPRCGTDKPVSDFPPNRSLADGLAAYCRQCKREADRERRHPKLAEPPASKAASAPKPKTLTPKLRRGGRPSTITPELIEAICAKLRRGHSRRVAARAAGINEDTLAQWCHRGREAPEPDAPTRVLLEAVLEAEGQGIEVLEQYVLDGAEIDPHMAMRALERRSPEDWARRERVELSNSNDKPMEVDDLRRLVIERLTKYLPAPTEAAALPAAAADPGPAS